MRQKYWYLGSICTVAMTVASILACGGDPSLQEECVLDDDCSFGVCDTETGFCVETCQSDSECPRGEICDVRPNAPGTTDKVCQADPNNNNNNNNNQCQDNEDCNAGEACVNGSCVPTTPQEEIYRYIMIEDTSSGSNSCESRTANGLKDAGSDIFAVELLDSQGQVIGYGEAIDYKQGSGEVDTTDFGIFDGNPRNVDQRQCPAATPDNSSFRVDSVVSLGCGGYLLLSFKGANGRPVNLANGMEIFVGEYAPICNKNGGSSTGSDRYTVNVCTDTESAANQDVRSCTRRLGMPIGGNGTFRISGL